MAADTADGKPGLVTRPLRKTTQNRHSSRIALLARLMLWSRVLSRILALAAISLGFLAPATLADEVVRIMAANTTSGDGQDYDLGHGNRIFQGLDPDIALIQEANYQSNSTANIRSWVDSNFGPSFQYTRESGKSIPNAIVSRYPILNSGVWDDPELSDREFVWARIDIPGDKHLWAVSIHLKASSGSTNSTRRNNSAAALVGYLQTNVPSGEHIVIGGDLNTYSRTEPCLGTFSEMVKTTSPWPADDNGNTNTNAGRSSPYDWVMPGHALAALSTPLIVGPKTFNNGIVFDSRVYSPLSAVNPVEIGDSSASGMQHMAVMRAFLIPTNDPPVIAQGNSVSVTLSKNNTPTAFSRSLSATDPENNTLTWSILTQAGHGTAGIAAPASGGSVNLSYQPALNYTGSDSFTVTVSDGRGGSDSILVNLTIEAVSALDTWTHAAFQPLDPEEEATVWGEAADPDQDGYTNLEEFAHGLDPKVADAAPNLLAFASLGTDHAILTFKMRMDGAAPALDYAIRSAGDPSAAWSPAAYTVLSDTDLGNGFTERSIRLESPPALSRLFYRLIYTSTAAE